MAAERIYYFCYDHNLPRGGQRHTYRHVDILNRHGFDAAVFHPVDGFRLTWFDNDTRVVDVSEYRRQVDAERDFVVLPEDLGTFMSDFPGRQVIFNKNLFYGFRCFGEAVPAAYPYQSPGVVAAFAVSEHNRAHLQYAFPNLVVEREYPDIRPDLYSYVPLAAKRPVISCMRKAPESLLALFHTLQARAAAGLNRGRAFEWIFLEDRSEAEAARILRESLLFVFLSVAEGLARMPLEAMACGTLVVAHPNGPLAEILPPAYRFEHSNIVAMAQHVESIMESYPDRLERWQANVQEGRRAAAEFSCERQERHLIDSWRRILARCGGGAGR